MHASDLHRARVIAGTPAHPSPSAPATGLHRQAALFERYREQTLAHGPRPDEPSAEAPAGTAGDHRATGGDDWLGGHAAFLEPQEPPRTDDETGGERQNQDDPGNESGSAGTEGDDADGNGIPAPAPSSTSPDAHRAAVAVYAQAALAARGMSPALAADAGTHPASGRLADYLVAEAAQLCSNPAILARGNWRMTLTLDPAMLPDSMLKLTLSHFDLALRFETANEDSRQLILQHAPTLRERLADLLETRTGAAHDVIVTVH